MQTENTTTQKPKSVSKKKEKLRVLIVQSTFLRSIAPAFLSLRLVQDSCQSNVSGLDGEWQVAWSDQRVIWRARLCPDVYPGNDMKLQSSKKFVSRLVRTRIESFLMPQPS